MKQFTKYLEPVVLVDVSFPITAELGVGIGGCTGSRRHARIPHLRCVLRFTKAWLVLFGLDASEIRKTMEDDRSALLRH